MAAAMCQALPSFYSDNNKKPLFISVSYEFYKKYKKKAKIIACLLTILSVLGKLQL